MSTTKIVVNPDKCKASGECTKVCPQKALSIKSGKAVIDYDKCDSDGMCVPACPQGAIEVVESDEKGG
jgi:Fe-S-cluster-containing hydrogenase component 2